MFVLEHEKSSQESLRNSRLPAMTQMVSHASLSVDKAQNCSRRQTYTVEFRAQASAVSKFSPAGPTLGGSPVPEHLHRGKGRCPLTFRH